MEEGLIKVRVVTGLLMAAHGAQVLRLVWRPRSRAPRVPGNWASARPPLRHNRFAGGDRERLADCARLVRPRRPGAHAVGHDCRGCQRPLEERAVRDGGRHRTGAALRGRSRGARIDGTRPVLAGRAARSRAAVDTRGVVDRACRRHRRVATWQSVDRASLSPPYRRRVGKDPPARDRSTHVDQAREGHISHDTPRRARGEAAARAGFGDTTEFDPFCSSTIRNEPDTIAPAFRGIPRHRDHHACPRRAGQTWRQPPQRGRGRRRCAVDDGRKRDPASGNAAGRRARADARVPALGQPALFAQDDRAAVSGCRREGHSRSGRRRWHACARDLRRFLGSEGADRGRRGRPAICRHLRAAGPPQTSDR